MKFYSQRFHRFGAAFLLGLLSLGFLASCQSVHPLVQSRNAVISQEPRGNHYIGRRFFGKASRVWGFVRRPGEPWEKSKLVFMYEGYKKTPDRFPEAPTPGMPTHGFDHNYEYRLYGEFQKGRPYYDPSTNLFFPVFILRDYELINRSPGFLFSPDELLVPGRLPRSY